MVEELKLAIKIDDDVVEQSLLKQFNNAEKMADKVVLTFKNINLDDKNIEAKFKEMQKMAGKNPIDLSINDKSLEMLSAINKQLSNIFEIAKGKSLIDSSSTVSEINKISESIEHGFVNSIESAKSKFESLKSEIIEVEKAYNKIKRNNYEKKESKYIDQHSDNYVDLSEYSSTKSTKSNFEYLESKLKEIYSLYNNINSAITNNSGWFNGEQYNSSDLEKIIVDFKSLAQAYYELDVASANTSYKDLSEEFGLPLEKIKTLKQVTSKMSSEFKNFVNEVISDSDDVKAHNKIFLEEEKRLIIENEQAVKSYVELRQQLLSKITNKEERYKISDYIPYIDKDLPDFSYMENFGSNLFGENIDVLKEMCNILGIEFPEAASKAEQKITNIEQQSSNSSFVENQDKIQEELKETEQIAEQTAEALEKVNLNGNKSNISSESQTVEVSQNDKVTASIRKKKEELASYELQLEETKYEIEELAKSENESFGFKKAYSNMNDNYINSRKEALYKSMFGTNKSAGQGSMKYQSMDFGGNVAKGYAAWREELERLGYTLSELRQTNIGFEADIIPIDGKAITNAEEFRKALFGITTIPSDNIELLNKQITELETKISLLKSEISSLESSKNSPLKDVFQDGSDSSSTSIANEQVSAMEKAETATEQAAQAKQDFVTANENVQSSVDGSKSPLQLEAELMQQIAKDTRDAADAKKEFVEANKQVEQSANDSNDSMNSGHSDNAEPSGTKRYKKKGYKAHDTGNHDNEETVAKKSELGATLKKLQSEIIASIDESTSFIKEVTDFYDSANDLVKTQMKVVDKDGSQRTYTTSYSKDGDDFNAWTSHIDTQKFKNAAEQEAKALNSAYEEATKINNALNETQILMNNLSKHPEFSSQFSETETKVGELNAQLKNGEISLSEYGKSVKSVVNDYSKLVDIQQKNSETQLNNIDKKISSFNSSLQNLSFLPDADHSFSSWTNKLDEISKKIQELETLKDNVRIVDGIADEDNLKRINSLTKEIDKLLTTAKKTPQLERGWKDINASNVAEKIYSILEKNTNMSTKAKKAIMAYYNEIVSGNPSKPLNEILNECIQIEQAERAAGRAGKSWLDIFKDKKIYGFIGQMASMFSFYDIINIGRQGIETIRELDTALTEMRKVSDESVQSLKNYQASTFDVADAVGTTAQQIQNSTADYMRLGESLEEASESARVANILLNVSEFDSISDATDSLVAMGQAYKDLEKIEIVDKLNEVGRRIIAQTYGNVWHILYMLHLGKSVKILGKDKTEILFFIGL